MSYAPLPSGIPSPRKDGSLVAGESFDTMKAGNRSESNSPPSFESIFTSNASIQKKALSCLSLIKYHIASRYYELRPWGEFFDMSSFVSPSGAGEVLSRLSVNCRYFYTNYLLLALIFSSYVLIVNLPFTICFFVGWLFLTYVRTEAASLAAGGNYFGDISLCGNPMPTAYLYGFIVVYGIIAFYFTGGSSVVFWLVFLAALAVVPHAAYRRPSIADPTYQLA